MAIQQNVNQILSLSAVFARMSPLGDMAEHNKKIAAEKEAREQQIAVEKEARETQLANAKKTYKQQSEVVKGVKRYEASNQIFPREEQLNAARELYKLQPTPKLAKDIGNMERGVREQQERAAKNEAAYSMRVEKARQDADRAREARLKLLEGVPLSKQSATYTQKLLESNTPMGEPLKENKRKKEEKVNG